MCIRDRIFIGVVFIGGRNLKLHETRFYSVTAQQADGKSTTGITTYYNANHSGVKPWKVRLNDNYAYGGSGLSESYSMASSGRVYADRYHYLVEYDRGLSLSLIHILSFTGIWRMRRRSCFSALRLIR